MSLWMAKPSKKLLVLKLLSLKCGARPAGSLDIRLLLFHSDDAVKVVLFLVRFLIIRVARNVSKPHQRETLENLWNMTAG